MIIPWNDLKNKPLKIIIKQVFVLINQRYNLSFLVSSNQHIEIMRITILNKKNWRNMVLLGVLSTRKK